MNPVLPDILQPGLKLVFCGTRPGDASARNQAYYAGPGNKFWPTLSAVGLISRKVMAVDFRMITEWGIGLTDMVKYSWGNDDTIARSEFDRDELRRKIEFYQPRRVAFNGKRAAAEFFAISTSQLKYGLQPELIGRTQAFVLPSTSGRAGSFWDIRPWHELARECRDQAAKR